MDLTESIEYEKQGLDKTGKINKKLTKIITNTLVGISSALIMQQPVNANDLTSPTLKNMILSPVYFFLDVNIWNGGDEENLTIKETINTTKRILIKFNIKSKFALQDFNNLFLKIDSNKVDSLNFINSFIKLGEKYNLSSDDTIKLFNEFNSQNYFSESFSTDLNKNIYTTFGTLYNYYGDQTDDKFKQIIEIYKNNGSLSMQDLKKIIPELIKLEINKSKKIIFILNISFLLLGIGTITKISYNYLSNKKSKNNK